MFDGLKNLAGMASIFKDLPKMQAKVEEIKKELADIQVQADSGGGAVQVVATADLKIASIQIDPALMAGLIEVGSTDDHAMAEDLILNAVNTALGRAREAAQEHLTTAASDMGLPISPRGLLDS